MGGGFSKQKVRVLVIGLDNSGKTTIVQRLKSQKDSIEVAPTVGFNQDQFNKYNLNYTFIDMSGQNQYRDMWEQQTKSIDGIIFVLDSSDKMRFSIVANELELLLSYESIKIRPIPLLFYANKQDLQGAEQSDYFIEYLKLQQIQDRSWHIISASASTGVGVEQGLDWLSQKIQSILKKK